MSLTTGPLGGETVAASPASQLDVAPLDGGSAQKKPWEYSSRTVRPLNQARVNPILEQSGPPLLHGSVLVTWDPEAIAGPKARPNVIAAAASMIRPTRIGLARVNLVIGTSFVV
jgi:hypothetical protein